MNLNLHGLANSSPMWGGRLADSDVECISCEFKKCVAAPKNLSVS